LKAMGLVGVGTLLCFAVLVAAILMLHAPGELVAVAMLVVGVPSSFAMVRVIQRYEAAEERRRREETLLR